jgi:endonuclease-3
MPPAKPAATTTKAAPRAPRRPARRQMTAAEIDAFFATLAAADPEPRTELAYGNGYQLLVAVVLSAQATDVGVNKATRALFEQVRTPEQMLALGEAGLKQHIRTIGLFNAKARNVIALSEILVRDHGSQVPSSRDVLETLPGVGRKTANVVLSVLFGQETCAVDTHVFRVANRTGLAPGGTPLAVENGIMKRVKPPWRVHAHHWLILHGRYTCTARAPKCTTCQVATHCQFRNKPAGSIAVQPAAG